MSHRQRSLASKLHCFTGLGWAGGSVSRLIAIWYLHGPAGLSQRSSVQLKCPRHHQPGAGLAGLGWLCPCSSQHNGVTQVVAGQRLCGGPACEPMRMLDRAQLIVALHTSALSVSSIWQFWCVASGFRCEHISVTISPDFCLTLGPSISSSIPCSTGALGEDGTSEQTTSRTTPHCRHITSLNLPAGHDRLQLHQFGPASAVPGASPHPAV